MSNYKMFIIILLIDEILHVYRYVRDRPFLV